MATPTPTPQIYDVIILGGGIAGLYSAHQICKSAPEKTVLVLEKEDVLGGRIKTYTDKLMSVEAGAGRFHGGHQLFAELLRELDLENMKTQIPSDNIYYDIVTKKPTENPNIPLIKKLIAEFDKFPPTQTKNMNVLQYAKHVLNYEEINLLKDTFGYYTELVTMNAHDCLSLFKDHLSADHTFYFLKGGMHQVVDKLEKQLLSKKCTILRKHPVTDIKKSEQGYEVSFQNRKRTHVGKTVISALPKQVLERMPFFTPIHNVLKHSIYCGALCRIYSVFPSTTPGGSTYWFSNLTKFNTNNNLRIVIPIHGGVIMSSYTDNKYAKFWKTLYETGGEKATNKELLKLLKESTGIENIPQPIKTTLFYWNCGVGYWTVGIDSKEIAEKIIHPMKSEKVFLCGEHFSEKNQQWIEGALETSKMAISKM